MVAMTAKKTTRLLLLIAGVAVFVHAGRSIYLGLTTVETGQLARGIRWLPPTAEDISYYQSYSFTAAEFRIDRAALEAWCADKGWPLKPLEKPFMIDRYCWPLTYKLAATMPFDELSKHPELEFTHTVARGLVYDYEQKNGGGLRIVFDYDHDMAYYQSSPR
jgi:hypothetical protein